MGWVPGGAIFPSVIGQVWLEEDKSTGSVSSQGAGANGAGAMTIATDHASVVRVSSNAMPMMIHGSQPTRKWER